MKKVVALNICNEKQFLCETWHCKCNSFHIYVRLHVGYLDYGTTKLFPLNFFLHVALK